MVALATSCTYAGGFFPMGVWYEGGVGEFRDNLIPSDPVQAASMYQRNFADISAHGVNAAVVPNTQPNHHKPLLDAAGANGVKLIIELDKEGGELGQMVRGGIPFSDDTTKTTFDTKLKPIMNHPALWGVQLLDEPNTDTYGRYATISKSLKAYAPRLLPFSCLIGNGPVEPFCATTKPQVVAFDCYTIGVDNKIGDQGPLLLYDAVTNAACASAAKHRVPVWAVIQAHSCGGLRQPAPSEIRCMTYTALANGCKGVWWFLYQTDTGMAGLVDSKFQETAQWTEVGKLTAELRKLTPILMNLTLVSDIPLKADCVAHVLKDSKGGLYIFAVNTDAASARKITLRLDSSAASNRDPRIIKLPGKDAILPNLFGDKIIWSDTLAPGDGALYTIK